MRGHLHRKLRLFLSPLCAACPYTSARKDTALLGVRQGEHFFKLRSTKSASFRVTLVSPSQLKIELRFNWILGLSLPFIPESVNPKESKITSRFPGSSNPVFDSFSLGGCPSALSSVRRFFARTRLHFCFVQFLFYGFVDTFFSCFFSQRVDSSAVQMYSFLQYCPNRLKMTQKKNEPVSSRYMRESVGLFVPCVYLFILLFS